MRIEEIEIIHGSLINGQRKQAVKQIEKYGLYDFFSDYKDYLKTLLNPSSDYIYFSDMVISYFRITNR